MTPLSVIKAAFTLWILWRFLVYFRSDRFNRHWTVFRGWSVKQWFGVSVLVLVELTVLLGLISWVYMLNNPVLNFSWIQLIATPGESGAGGTNLMVDNINIPWFQVVFCILLMLNLPYLARLEESVFRRGTRNWADAVPRSIKFGLMHMIVGVPFCAALGLIGLGFVLTLCYFRGGMRLAWFFHTFHNFVLVTLLIIAILLG